MPSDLSLISVKCAAHGGRATLSEAVLKNWRMCNVCHLFVCQPCADAFFELQGGSCPGSTAETEHVMDLVPIPSNEVVQFVEKTVKAPEVGELVYEAFFKDRVAVVDPLAASTSLIEKKARKEELDAIAVLRQEQWRNMGTVMVKRARGRFVTWEAVA